MTNAPRWQQQQQQRQRCTTIASSSLCHSVHVVLVIIIAMTAFFLVWFLALVKIHCRRWNVNDRERAKNKKPRSKKWAWNYARYWLVSMSAFAVYKLLLYDCFWAKIPCRVYKLHNDRIHWIAHCIRCVQKNSNNNNSYADINTKKWSFYLQSYFHDAVAIATVGIAVVVVVVLVAITRNVAFR